MAKMVQVMLCLFYHNKNKKTKSIAGILKQQPWRLTNLEFSICDKLILREVPVLFHQGLPKNMQALKNIFN